MLDIHPIQTEDDYKKALREIESLWDADLSTPEGEKLQILGVLVDAYEEAHFPIDKPTPIQAIKCRMDQLGLTQKDLKPYIGSSGRVSEILNAKRPLTLQMIRRLHKNLHIPIEILAQQYMTKETGKALPKNRSINKKNRDKMSAVR